ncbi:MAG: hypothetical protein KC561_14855 [Myxococcales bacterium]|nr:hypothetical protein [Myxococcales bacterium]
MPVNSKHILSQGSVIAAIGRSAFEGILQQVTKKTPEGLETPGPEIRKTLSPRPADLVKDYVRHVGGDPRNYSKHLPAHLFPQWGFGPATRTLSGIPYPLLKVMNGGCRIEAVAPLPSDEPLEVSARLESIDDNGSRAVLHQRVVTGTKQVPEAVIAHMYPIVPLGGPKDGAPRKSKDKPRVPHDAKEVQFWRIGANAGLDFAKLTGDFNPIHWVPAYAKASGFRNTILHGFSTLARAWEGLNQGLFAGSPLVRTFDAKFTRPLVLPAKVGLYVKGNEVYVGDAPGGPAYMIATFEADSIA